MLKGLLYGIRLLGKLLLSLILTVLFGCGLLYVQTIIYDFPEPKPFAGENLLNPYQGLDGKQTLKANFHAHSIAWKQITNGHDTPEELSQAYTARGYDVACISNYHCLEPKDSNHSPIYIAAYEHGINIMKSHKLGINPKRASLFDFPLWQNTSQKQQIINIIRENGGLVTINHPIVRNGHSIRDLEQLTGYQFIEVLNHYANSSASWDAALQTGHLVYVVGNDDTHDIDKEPTFKKWNEIYAEQKTAESVLSALQKGHSYGVDAKDGIRDFAPSYLSTNGDTISYSFQSPCNNVKIIGPNQTLLAESNENTGRYILDKKMPFARILASSDQCQLYMNPIVRYTIGQSPGIGTAVAKVNLLLTWLYRLLVIAIELVILAAIYFIWKRKANS
ncbi:MAG: hypothetical protein ABIV51_10435 [Saprospiraceae bacterium]